MSEFSLIYTHFKNLTARHPATVVGIGDDSAVSTLPPNHQLVSCVDTLVAGRHFPLSTSPYAIGYKSVVVNLSDIASMGATPYAILLGLSLPTALANDTTWIKDFTQGIADICGRFGVDLIGGDTTKSDILTISVTALGFVPNGQAIVRSGAKVGDIVCVSGDIGSASFALKKVLEGQVLQQEKQKPFVVSLSNQNGFPTLRQAQCERKTEAVALQNAPLQETLDLPFPQVELGKKLLSFANSMIDISDGLGQDLGHILTASDVGAVIDLAKLPTHPLLQKLPNAEKWQHQLNGGDDYQLCFTLSQAKFETFNQCYPNQIFAIGEIVTEKGLQLFYNGEKVDFIIQGFQHF